MHWPRLSLQVSRLCWSCSAADRLLSFPCQDDKRIVLITAGSFLGSQLPAESSNLAVDVSAGKEKVYFCFSQFNTPWLSLVYLLFPVDIIDDKMRNKMYL